MYHLAYGDMMDGWGNGYGYGNNGWSWIFMLLMMALVVLVVIWAVRYLGHEWRNENRSETALDILKKRYANSEIDKKEFEEMKMDFS